MHRAAKALPTANPSARRGQGCGGELDSALLLRASACYRFFAGR